MYLSRVLNTNKNNVLHSRCSRVTICSDWQSTNLTTEEITKQIAITSKLHSLVKATATRNSYLPAGARSGDTEQGLYRRARRHSSVVPRNSWCAVCLIVSVISLFLSSNWRFDNNSSVADSWLLLTNVGLSKMEQVAVLETLRRRYLLLRILFSCRGTSATRNIGREMYSPSMPCQNCCDL